MLIVLHTRLRFATQTYRVTSFLETRKSRIRKTPLLAFFLCLNKLNTNAILSLTKVVVQDNSGGFMLIKNQDPYWVKVVLMLLSLFSAIGLVYSAVLYLEDGFVTMGSIVAIFAACLCLFAIKNFSVLKRHYLLTVKSQT